MQLPLYAKRFFQQRMQLWIQRRLPAQSPQTLDRFKLIIFPSRSGLAFIVVDILLWLIGTNYQNNIIIGLALLLCSLFVVSILHTFSNLSGVTIRALGATPAFCGEAAEVEVMVNAEGSRQYENILLCWPGGGTAVANLIDHRETTVKLFVPTKQRGWMNPGRLLIETYYPLGMIRCWTWLDLDVHVLVYPKPIFAGRIPPSQMVQDQGSRQVHNGTEDFTGLNPYRPGEPLRHIAWKHYAQGRGLYTKEFSASVDQRLWLEWDFFAGFDIEARLSRLCYWVLDVSKTQNEYGLRLPGLEVKPGKGLEHKRQVLKALALFNRSGGAGR